LRWDGTGCHFDFYWDRDVSKEIRSVSLDVTLSAKDRRDILKLFDGYPKVRKILAEAKLYVRVEVEITEQERKTA
jgi:hypothetical protein